MKKIQTVRSAVASQLSNENLAGRVSNQTATSHPNYPEIEQLTGTFKISVKVDETDDDGNVTGKKELYSNDAEEFAFYKVPSLVSALRLEGAKLTEDAVQFIEEALKGSKETGEAVKAIIEVYNNYLEQSAQRRRYSAVLNEKTPMTEENRDNAMARSVRSFVQMAGVSPEVAITMLKSLNPSPLSADYTLTRFLSNKSKR